MMLPDSRVCSRLVCCVAATVLGCALALSGCAGTPAAIIGTQSAGAASFKLVNGLGKYITSMAYKQSNESDFGEDLAQSQFVELDETADVYVDIADAKTKYDVRVCCDDGTLYDLHDVKLGDVSDATLKRDGQVGYLVYKSLKNGTERDTLKHEQGLVEQRYAEIAEAKEEAARKKAEQEKKERQEIRKAVEEEVRAEVRKEYEAELAEQARLDAERAQAAAASEKSSTTYASSSSSSSSSSSESSSSSKSSSASKSASSKKTSTSSKPSSSKTKTPSSTKPSTTASKPSSSSSSSKSKDPTCVDDILLK